MNTLESVISIELPACKCNCHRGIESIIIKNPVHKEPTFLEQATPALVLIGCLVLVVIMHLFFDDEDVED